MRALLLPLALSAAVALGDHPTSAQQLPREATGGAPCTTGLDCQLNGVCADSKCVCDAAFTGANCSALALLPATRGAGYGALGSDTSSWGGSFTQDGESWVGFVSEMGAAEGYKGCGLGTWAQNSRCVVARAPKADGSYVRERVLVDSWCHGATASRDPVSRRFIWLHMGDGKGQGKHQTKPWCVACPADNGTTPSQGPFPTGAPPPPQPPCMHEGVADSALALVSNSSAGPFLPALHIPNRAGAEAAFMANGTLWISLPATFHSSVKCTGCAPGQGGPGCVSRNGFFRVVRAETLAEGLAGKFENMPMTYELAGAKPRQGKLTPDSNSSICFNWCAPFPSAAGSAGLMHCAFAQGGHNALGG